MRKIDYGKIKWDAGTTWEFCGSSKNFTEIRMRYNKNFNASVNADELGYMSPYKGLAFDRGDVVTCTYDGVKTYATVEVPISPNGYLCIRLPNGHQVQVHPNDIKDRLAIADVPEELVALARAEAGRPIDFSKRPLERQGACMEA